MIIDGKRSILRFQPHEGKRLDLVDHLINRAFFAIKQPIVSFLPYFPICREPNNLKDGPMALCGTTATAKLIKMI